MDAEDHRGGLRTPIIAAEAEASGSNRDLEAHKAIRCSAKTLRVILSLQFLEVAAFYGVYLNLIVYLQDVLHGDTASNVAAVNTWAAVSYLMPVLGAVVADSYWGKYKTVLIGLSVSVVGLAMVTTSATLPSLRPPPFAPATIGQKVVFFSGIYLCAVGIGASKAVFISFAAEQFDDDAQNVLEREAKASYFSLYYAVANMAMLTAGTLLVWVEDKVSWGLGYGVCASFAAVAVVALATTAPMYRILPPVGSPSKGLLQVLVAFSHKINLTVPDDATQLYEEDDVQNPVRERLQHTDQFR
uniref:Uncharacterized protein n=1 Tax=Avena sativa TaxID=4498 RepID=A0ACD5UEA5_AVESA